MNASKRLYFLDLVLLSILLSSAYGAASIRVPQSSLMEPKSFINGDDEVVAMNHLMENTSHQLGVQKHMHELMLDFRRQKEEFAGGNQTKAHAAQMVRTARQIYESITTYHLHYLFSQEYLEELLFFSSIAGKNRIKST